MSDIKKNNFKDEIIDVNIEHEMKQSYLDYAMSVIVSRALPDVRDGLKPVHRRILYALSELNFTPNKPHRKSARIVGDVLGKYHPHGDSSVYNAMVRMAQDFSTRYMLVDGHGNFGSIDGDGAAAMRYTEARMNKISLEMLKDINKNTVDFSPNFDDTLKEPTVLPARYPNLLVNGSNGIAVGMATSIPPHNLCEVIDGVIELIDNPEATVEDLMQYVKGPDFPTGAEIMGKAAIKRAYTTGRGKVKVRSKVDIIELNRGKSAIIVNEIPYQVNKSRMIENIAKLVRDKKIDGITDLRDESDRNGIRVVIELRKNENPEIVLNKLYKKSQLQITYSIILLALVNNEPKVLNLLDILSLYLEHQKDVETRRIKYDLKKAEDRAHILEGYQIALNNIDRVVEVIRASKDKKEAYDNLMEEFPFSERQAEAILNMRLHRLTGLEQEKIQAEYDELMKTIEHLKSLLADESKLLNLIKNDLIKVKEQYGDDRRTEISIDVDEINIEDLIEEHPATITLTEQGYIKRLPTETYSTQHRGGRGKKGMATKEEDNIIEIFNTSSHDYLLFFTNKGKVFRKKAFRIPEATRASKGTAIINLLKLDSEEKVTSIIPIKSFEEGYLTFFTEKGKVKKTKVNKFDTSRVTGIKAIRLMDDDQLITVKRTNGNNELMIISNKGKAIRFSENDVRNMGRNSIGVNGINLEIDDYVIAAQIIDENQKLLVVSENGYGKRTEISEYNLQKRNGKGVKTYNVRQKTGKLVGALMVDNEDEILIINSKGIIIRIKVADISVNGRVTSGVKVMNVEANEQVIAIAKVKKESLEDDQE